MADATRKTRLSPPLMHVFRAAHLAKDAATPRDVSTEAGERILAGRRLTARQAITEPVLRREVARDLAALLNTVAMESTVELTDAEWVRKSVLNYGLPDIGRHGVNATAMKMIPQEIRAAIVNYEPRLAAASLHIERDPNPDGDQLRMRFVVQAELTCEPVHAPVEFTAEVTEAGEITVSRL
jgi:type VI secretion system protein ImpF